MDALGSDRTSPTAAAFLTGRSPLILWDLQAGLKVSVLATRTADRTDGLRRLFASRPDGGREFCDSANWKVAQEYFTAR